LQLQLALRLKSDQNRTQCPLIWMTATLPNEGGGHLKILSREKTMKKIQITVPYFFHRFISVMEIVRATLDCRKNRGSYKTILIEKRTKNENSMKNLGHLSFFSSSFVFTFFDLHLFRASQLMRISG